MSTLQEWLALYPAWPLPLAEKFLQCIENQLSQYANYADYFNFSKIVIPIDYYGQRIRPQVKIHKPTNQRYTETVSQHIDIKNWYSYQFEKVYVDITYDSRIVSDVVAEFAYLYGRQLINSSHYFTFYDVYEIQRTDLLVSYTPASAKNASSVLAYYENGVNVPAVDYILLYEFQTYLNAYRKFSSQIEAEARNAQQVAQDAIADYQEQLRDKIRQEQSALQNLSFSMAQASENEMRSAERDLTNLALNAQSLKINLENLMR